MTIDGNYSVPLLLPIPGEGWDGGTHDAGTVSALAPTLTLPRKGREQDENDLSSYIFTHKKFS